MYIDVHNECTDGWRRDMAFDPSVNESSVSLLGILVGDNMIAEVAPVSIVTANKCEEPHKYQSLLVENDVQH